MLGLLLETLSSHPLLSLFCLLTAIAAYNKFAYGLNRYPGPLLASFTNWWRFYDVYKGHAEDTHLALHRRHGKVVRLGPNLLSFSDPTAIKDIYGLNKGFYKTEFYPIQQNVSQGVRIPSLFSTLDESYHALFRRHVSGAFAMSTLISYEPLVDETIDVLLKQTRKLYADTGKVCDFARWVQFFAFDVIGSISFSKRLGFLEQNKDVDGIVQGIANMLAYAGYIGQQPWLDRYFLDKNPIKLWMMRLGLIKSSSAVAIFTQKCIETRQEEFEKLKADSNAESLEDTQRGVDFLTRFKMVQKAHPEFMNDRRVLTATTSLVNAGSDTTAISISSVFHYLMKHPDAYRRLMQELDSNISDGSVTLNESGVMSWADSQKLPYLDAVIQESFRCFPAVGLLLERHVPDGGAIICGEHVPGGTIVGANAWVLHRQEEIFGEDVDMFKPERWIKADAEQRRQMNATMFQFGAGARTCIGKNISLLEIYKVVPTLLLAFEFEQVKEWTTLNCWFVRQLGFEMKIRPRRMAGTIER